MDTIKKLERVAQFNAERGQKTFHPLVSVLDQSKSKPIEEERYISDQSLNEYRSLNYRSLN